MNEWKRWIKRVVDEHGTQKDLARELGVMRSTVSSWCRGSPPSLNSAKKLSALTGVPVTAIQEMSGAQFVHGDGNRYADREGEATLPASELKVHPLDEEVWSALFNSTECVGCKDRRFRNNDHKERAEECRVLGAAGLPLLCQPWTRYDVARMVERVAKNA
jgi:transcriptional regulator with XRE-family HTH domain